MKHWKKILYLVPALALIAALACCGSFSPRFAVGLQKLSQLNSFRSDTTLEVELTVSLLGQEFPVELNARARGEHQRQSALNAVDIDFSVWDYTQNILLFTRQEGEALSLSFSLDGGKTWAVETLAPEGSGQDVQQGSGQAAPTAAPADLLKLALALGNSFEEVESGDAALICYEGEIPAEVLQEVLRSTGALERMAELLEITLEEDAVSRVGSVPATVAIDRENGMIVRVGMDLTDACSGVVGALITPLLAEYGLRADEAALQITKIEIAVDLSDFDSVTVVPPMT